MPFSNKNEQNSKLVRIRKPGNRGAFRPFCSALRGGAGRLSREANALPHIILFREAQGKLFRYGAPRVFAETASQRTKWAIRSSMRKHSGPGPIRGDGGFVIEFGGVCYQDTYPMYLACILYVFCMYLDVIRSYTSRYTKIHQDTSRYICIYLFGYHGNVSYLGICILFYDTFKIHSKYF